MIRFGIQVQGRAYVDNAFTKESNPHTPLLLKLLHRSQLTEAEVQQLQKIPMLVRRALRGLTARALRALCLLCDPLQLRGQGVDRTRESSIGILNFLFPPAELMLAAGSTGNIRYADPAARFYETPPQLAEERWLFEWQPGELHCPWPVMANKLASRKTNVIAQFGLLAQTLTSMLGLTRQDAPPLSAELLATDENVYFIVSSSAYCTLLTYAVSQRERLLKSLQELVLTFGGIATPTVPPLPLLRARPLPEPAGPQEGTGPATERAPAAATPLPAAATPPAGPATSAGEPPAWGHDAAAWFEAADLSALAGPGAAARGSSMVTPVAPAPAAAVREIPATAALAAAEPPPAQAPNAATAVLAAAEPPPAQAPNAATAVLAAAAAPPAQAKTAVTAALAAAEALPAPATDAAAVALAAEEPPPAPAVNAPAPAPTAAPDALAPLLELRGFTARLDDRTILKEIDLQIGRKGVYCLMGPGGSGKSSLLGVLGGRYRCAFGWSLTGTISYDGRTLRSARRPAVIGQKLGHPAMPLRDYLLAELEEEAAKAIPYDQLEALLARVRLEPLLPHLAAVLGTPPLALTKGQWWQLAIARELVANPPLLCVDEPTAGLEDAEAALLLAILRAEGEQRTIFFVTHNQQHARACSDYMVLLAGGRVQEVQPTAAFFAAPQSQPAKDFVRTGGCAVPSPDARAEQLEPELAAAAPADEPPGAADPPLAAASDLPPAALAPQPSSATDSAQTPLWACSQATTASLRLRDFGLKMGERIVLSGISLDIAERGLHLLVTPDGAHKRLFLRALAGPRPGRLELLGEATYRGRSLLDGEGPATPYNEARLAMLSVRDYLTEGLPGRSGMDRAALNAYVRTVLKVEHWQQQLMPRLDATMCDLETTQRRVLEILRATQDAPALLLLDDPLAGVGEAERPHLLGLLAAQAAERALLLLVSDATPFLASDFTPAPAIAWLSEGRLGSIPPPPPAAVAPDPAPAPPAAAAELPPPPEVAAPADSLRSFSGPGPRGFRWLRPGALAGMPAPGLTSDLAYDLDLIHQTGITRLITLTTEALPAAPLQERGIAGIFFPIEDMDVPSLAEALALCRNVAGLLESGQAVGYHCKAGMGRTGTMLAAQLIWEGRGAAEALTQVRAVEPGWVQSEKQVRFLFEFSDWLQKQPAPTGDTSAASSVMLSATSNQPGRCSPTQQGERSHVGT